MTSQLSWMEGTRSWWRWQKRFWKREERDVEEKGLKRSLLEGNKERARRSHFGSIWRSGFASALQQERRSCVVDECWNAGRRPANEAVGGEGEGEKKEVRCDILAYQEKSGLPEKYMRTGVTKLLRVGLVPARGWVRQAVGIAPTQRLKLWRRMAAAVGKKESVSLSLFLKVNSLEVEELSTMATLAWAKGVWLGRWEKVQLKAWRKQIREVQTWTRERTCRSPVTWASSSTLELPMNPILRKAGELVRNSNSGKQKGNLEALSKKVNFMSEILAHPVLRNNTWGNLTTSRLWQQSSVEFGEKNAQCWAREIEAQIKMDTLRRRSKDHMTVLTVNGKVQNTSFLFMISICS